MPLKISIKYVFFLICSLLLSQEGIARELNCKVSVNVGPRVQTTETRIFQDMETNIAQFMNEREWTEENFENEERINCNIIITIEKMPSISAFEATVQIQSSRPIYGTSYESLLFYTFADKDWQFEYRESQPLEYDDNTFRSNLTSLLAFYAYTIIGFDFDSFSELGGEKYFNKALNIVNNAQQAGYMGWKQFDGNRNRYWLIENLTNQQLEPIRKGLYTYHRLVLDNFEKEPDAGREKIASMLEDFQKVNELKPNQMLMIVFFDAKNQELINMFSEGDMAVRRKAYNLLVELDPTQASEFEKIIKN